MVLLVGSMVAVVTGFGVLAVGLAMAVKDSRLRQMGSKSLSSKASSAAGVNVEVAVKAEQEEEAQEEATVLRLEVFKCNVFNSGTLVILQGCKGSAKLTWFSIQIGVYNSAHPLYPHFTPTIPPTTSTRVLRN